MRQILIPVFVLWSSLCGGVSLAEGGPVARIGESGEFLELEYQVNGHGLQRLAPALSGRRSPVFQRRSWDRWNAPPSILRSR